MFAASRNIKKVKGASRRQYGFIAFGKKKNEGDKSAVVGTRKIDKKVSRKGLSQGARTWHMFTDGGEPICDVCKRVGHVAKNCWRRKKTSLSGRRDSCRKNAGMVVQSVVEYREGYATAERHLPVSVNKQRVEALLDFNAMENAVDFRTVLSISQIKFLFFSRWYGYQQYV